MVAADAEVSVAKRWGAQRCLFCKREHDALTEEHVFPAALGGDLVVRNSVCKECNGNFSRDFEQAVARELAPIRHLLVIPDRFGKIPEVFAKAEVDGKVQDAKLLGGGKVQLKPVVTIIEGAGGLKEILYQHLTEKQKEEKRSEAKEKGYQLIESEVIPGQQVEVSVTGSLEVIGSREALRTAAKVAIMGLARFAGRAFVLRDMFDEVRTYVRTGDGKSSARLFLNERFLAACAQGPRQHSLVIAGRNNKHCIDAIVRVFGGLCFFVSLTERHEGADFYDTLVYDAQRGEVNKVLVVNEQAEILQIEDVATSKNTIWDDAVASGTWFVNFIDGEIRAKSGG